MAPRMSVARPFIHMNSTEVQRKLGVSPADCQNLKRYWDAIPADPVYSFRKSTQERFLFDQADGSLKHLQAAPFVLDANENSLLEDTPRQFGSSPAGFLETSVCQSIVHSLVRTTCQHPELPALSQDAARDSRVLVSVHQFRISYDPMCKESANVTPEGVHQDGAEHVVIMMMGSENKAPSSALSRIYPLSQPLGAPQPSDPTLLDAELQPGEVLFVADRLVKHDVTPLLPADWNKPASRDVIVAWSRRPVASDDLVPRAPAFQASALQASQPIIGRPPIHI
jgi:hypothetical protein